MTYFTSKLNSPILVPSIVMTIVAVPTFWPSIAISTDPSFTSLILEIFGSRILFVERILNENGSKPEYFSPVFLSLILSVAVATSPSLIGVLETSVITRSFCVMKCLAISLKLLNSSDRFLYIESCETTVGIVGTIICGTVGVVGITTGVVGGVGTVGVITTGIIGVVGVVGGVGTVVGRVGTIPVVFTMIHVFTVGMMIESVGMVVLLL